MGYKPLTAALLVVAGCSHSPAPDTVSSMTVETATPSQPPAAITSPSPTPYNEMAANPVVIFIDATTLMPVIGASSGEPGRIGNYVVTPGQVIPLVARTSDGSAVQWRVLETVPGEGSAGTVDAQGVLTVKAPGRIAVVATTPSNRDRIGWIVFASVGSPAPAMRIGLPHTSTLGEPVGLGDEYYRGFKIFTVSTQGDWQTLWSKHIRFPQEAVPARPDVDFSKFEVLCVRRDLVQYEREPVITEITADKPRVVRLVVPAKANWRWYDPVTQTALPGHLTLFQIPRGGEGALRLNLDSPRGTMNMGIPEYSEDVVNDKRLPGPASAAHGAV